MGIQDRDYYWEHRDEQEGKPRKQRYTKEESYQNSSNQDQPAGTVYSGWAGPAKPRNAKKSIFAEGSRFEQPGTPRTDKKHEKTRSSNNHLLLKNIFIAIFFWFGVASFLKIVVKALA